MTVRAKIIDFLTTRRFLASDRMRVIQTLEILGSHSPFTTPRYQGDTENECTELRKWANSYPYMLSDKTYYEWVSKCPFVKELPSANEEWSLVPIWGGNDGPQS